MALTYTQIYGALVANAPTQLEALLTIGIMRAAVTVINEAAGTSNHANRLVWAGKVIAFESAKMEAKRMLGAVLCDGVVGALANPNLATDTQVNTSITALIDTFANLG